MATRKRRLRAKNRMGVVVPFDVAAQDITMANGKDLETEVAEIKASSANKEAEDIIKQNVNTVQANLQRLYAALGEIAFWQGKPASSSEIIHPLNWNVPKKTLTINNNIEHSIISYNSEPVSGSIQVDAGETIDLIVSGETGYEVTSVQATGATIIQNLNGTFTVRVKVENNMTLAISGTVVVVEVVVGINYNLTHLTATTGPTSVAQGGSASIVIAAEANHALPLAVQVSGATLDSYNKSTGAIEISNATTDVIITADAICRDFVFLKGFAIIDFQTRYTLSAENPNYGGRACVLLPRTGLVNPFAWVHGTYTQYDAEKEALYSSIPIPYGATKVKILMTNSNYNISSCISGADGVNKKEMNWDSAQSAAREYILSNYAGATHIGINLKKTDSGYFSNETLSDLGFDLIFE